MTGVGSPSSTVGERGAGAGQHADRDLPPAFAESEERHRLALEAAGLGTWRYDAATGEVTLDERAQRHFGLEQPRVIMQAVLDAAHPGDREMVAEATRRGLDPAGSGRVSCQHRVLLPTGEVRWLDVHVVIHFQGQGAERRPRLAIATSRDITEARRANEILHERLALREQLAAIAASAPGMIYSLRQEPDGRVGFEFVSAAVEPLFGLRPEEVVGRPEGSGALLERVHPEDRPALRELARAAPQAPGPLAAVYRVLHPQRGELWLESRARPVQGPGGARLWHGVTEDITARHRAEEALRASEDRYRQLVDNLDEVVFSIDLEGRITFINRAAERFGYQPGDLIGRHRDTLIEPADLGGFLQRTGQPGVGSGGPVEYHVIDASGRRRAVRSNTRPLYAGGQLVGVTGVLTDLSQQREIEEQLRAAQKLEAVGRLAGGVAHDFNNLLTVILSYSELATSELRPEDPMHADLEEVSAAAQRAQGLTRQLLAFSRRQVLSPEPVDLAELVNGLARMLRRLIGEHIELEVTAPPGLPPARLDRGQIEQVVMNLVVNARDAMPDGGRIGIRLGRRGLEAADAAALEVAAGDYLELEVSDEGCGMDDATRQHIFEPFFTTKGPGHGTGLGLSTVYGIVKQSHGGIAVDSAVDQGTRVRVLLPTHHGEAAPAAERVNGRPRRPGQELLLVVEDDAALRTLVKRVLGAAGYRLLLAAEPQEALRLATDHGPEIALVLTDVVMPGMNGREMVARLSPLCPQAKILFTSGYLGEAIERIGLGSDNLLAKPYDWRTLESAVRSVLDG